MNHLFHTDEEDEERQWLEGMENQDEPEIKEAVRIQDPISKMMMTKPLTIELGTSLRHVLDQMQDHSQNCALVVDNGILTGILNERDILLKITGKGYDFDVSVVDEFMSPNPETLTPEDSLAYALNKMHIGGFRNVPIVDDEHCPVGSIGITDIISIIADYFSTEIINLPPLDKAIDTQRPEGG